MADPQAGNSLPFSLTGTSRLASIVCLTLLVSALSVWELQHSAKAESPASKQPSLTLLRNESRALLRKEAVLDSGPAKDAAATALCDLYVILRLDSRYSGSDMLKGDATKIRRRLITISKKKELQLKRNGVARPANLSSSVTSIIAATILQNKNKAAGGQTAAQNGGGATGTGSDTPVNSSDQQDNTSSASGQTSSASGQDQSTKQDGPSGLAAAGMLDTGWELIELIQRIISPDFWESRGGPGSIRYFAMRRVLVIRATTDVHEQIRDLLMALR